MCVESIWLGLALAPLVTIMWVGLGVLLYNIYKEWKR